MITVNSSILRISVQHCDDTISKVLLNSADAAHTGTHRHTNRHTDTQTWIRTDAFYPICTILLRMCQEAKYISTQIHTYTYTYICTHICIHIINFVELLFMKILKIIS